jgi:hypothetical protein
LRSSARRASSGSISAALAAVRNARFVPYRENGVPHPAVAHVPVRFALDG